MQRERLVALRDDDPELLERIAEARRAGAIPLVGDSRWPAEQWAVAHRVVDSADPLPGIAWASLTSGTTALPRVVLRSAESWSRSFPLVERLLEADADDVVALTAPASSSLTLFSIAHALGGGPRVALAGPVRRPTGAVAVDSVGTSAGARAGSPRSTREHAPTDPEYGDPSAHEPRFCAPRSAPSAFATADLAEATRFHGTPQGLARLLDARERTGASSGIRVALIGGSRLDRALRERAAHAGIRIVAYYGAAELSFVAVDQGDGLRAADGVELETRDDALWVRSPFVAAGYLRGAGLRGGALERDARGFATVGDRARVDPATGALTLLGRRDGAILSASATVVPEEVEDVLRDLPGIADLVVVGVPAAGIGELVVAVVEPEGAARPSGRRDPGGLRDPGEADAGDRSEASGPARPLTASALRAVAAERLTGPSRPRRWFAGELPRTPSGKIARGEVVRRLAEGAFRLIE